MLDIRFIRENPSLVRDAARKKKIEFNVDLLLELDAKRRLLRTEVEAMRAELNTTSDAIGKIVDEEVKREAIEKMREFKSVLEVKEKDLSTLEEEFEGKMYDVPNIPDPSVPEGSSDADNKEIRRWGEPPTFSFEPKGHTALLKELELADFERGVKVSGMRGYFLKNDAVLLIQSLMRFTLDHMATKGFVPIMAPALVHGRNLFGSGHFPQAREDVYQVDTDEYLAGTAEIPLMGMHADEIFEETDFPKKYVALSPCYRKEAGAYGKYAKGLYRLHEFLKVEQLVLIENNHQKSVEWHEALTKNAEEILQALGLHYRVVLVSAGDLGRAHVKTYDIETWIPSEKSYRESHSSSYYHDFQTRRLNIRYRNGDGDLRFAHSLNNTAIATPRILISLLEQYQQQDGSVKIPEALQPLMGKNEIRRG